MTRGNSFPFTVSFNYFYFQTPVIHALGVVLQDEKIWPLPNK